MHAGTDDQKSNIMARYTRNSMPVIVTTILSLIMILILMRITYIYMYMYMYTYIYVYICLCLIYCIVDAWFPNMHLDIHHREGLQAVLIHICMHVYTYRSISLSIYIYGIHRYIDIGIHPHSASSTTGKKTKHGGPNMQCICLHSSNGILSKI